VVGVCAGAFEHCFPPQRVPGGRHRHSRQTASIDSLISLNIQGETAVATNVLALCCKYSARRAPLFPGCALALLSIPVRMSGFFIVGIAINVIVLVGFAVWAAREWRRGRRPRHPGSDA